jgi:hypothetical protein
LGSLDINYATWFEPDRTTHDQLVQPDRTGPIQKSCTPPITPRPLSLLDPFHAPLSFLHLIHNSRRPEHIAVAAREGAMAPLRPEKPLHPHNPSAHHAVRFLLEDPSAPSPQPDDPSVPSPHHSPWPLVTKISPPRRGLTALPSWPP